jgi:GDPmannose 4,6-dehydratase
MHQRALIVGIGGQDGSLLAEVLLERGYDLAGVVRGRGSYANLDGFRDRVSLYEADLVEEAPVVRSLEEFRPHEVYNLASVSFAPASWEEPVLTAQVGAVGTTVLLESIRRVDPSIRFCHASSSEIFGRPEEAPQTELTPLRPLSPYGAAKAFGFAIVQGYRRRYGLFACSAVLYNHESQRRPLAFLPRKVAHGAAAISLGLETELVLGDLHPRRDWGYAPDYVDAMWRMLQHTEPEDFVIATGVAHSVEELVACAFDHVGLDWRRFVRCDASLVRGESEVLDLVGDSSKARELLGWVPSMTFEALIQLLVDAELERLRAHILDSQHAPL